MNSLYLVVGLGKTGHSIAQYLQRKNHHFMVFDTRINPPDLEAFKAEFPNIPVYLEYFPDELLTHITDIITSPGISLDLALFKKAQEKNIPVYGDIECLAREITAPVVAITGTNGKSTVTTLVGEMAKASGMRVAVAGNIGTPVLDMLKNNQPYDLWVLELSSFQLDLTHSLKPEIATILNISPDHLDRHHSLEAYTQAKQRIYQQAKIALWNRDDEATPPMTATKSSLSFGQGYGDWGLIKKDNLTYLAKGDQCLIAVDSLLIKGVHNWFNALAACALADAVHIPMAAILKILETFPGLPHRCEWVRELDGVAWINDSKGTNIGAAISAINGIGGAITGKIVLIAGGQGKGADFASLQQPVADFVRSVVLIGEDAFKLERSLAKVAATTKVASLEEAVSLARTKAQPGDVVLLSPACASLDMFKDFNHRGEVFASSVHGL
mgnify:CR=1 FL=1